MKKAFLFDQIKVKRRKNILWIILLFCILLGMITSTILCPINDYNPLSKLTKLFPPFILAIVLYLWQLGRYYFLVYNKYHKTTFSIHPKRQRFDNPDKYELITFKNRILFRKQNDPKDEGEIVLDLINLKYGRGFHSMNNDGNDSINDYSYEDRFGFSQFIVTKNKIFVESPYIKPETDNFPNGKILYQVFIWIREDK